MDPTSIPSTPSYITTEETRIKQHKTGKPMLHTESTLQTNGIWESIKQAWRIVTYITSLKRARNMHRLSMLSVYIKRHQMASALISKGLQTINTKLQTAPTDVILNATAQTMNNMLNKCMEERIHLETQKDKLIENMRKKGTNKDLDAISDANTLLSSAAEPELVRYEQYELIKMLQTHIAKYDDILDKIPLHKTLQIENIIKNKNKYKSILETLQSLPTEGIDISIYYSK